MPFIGGAFSRGSDSRRFADWNYSYGLAQRNRGRKTSSLDAPGRRLSAGTTRKSGAQPLSPTCAGVDCPCPKFGPSPSAQILLGGEHLGGGRRQAIDLPEQHVQIFLAERFQEPPVAFLGARHNHVMGGEPGFGQAD